jgi:hypothetical protein
MRENIKNSVVKLIFVTFCLLIFIPVSRADDEKYKARLSVDFISIVNDHSFLSINVKFKGEDGYEPATDLTLNIYQQLENDSIAYKGEALTNEKGNAEFRLEFEDNLKDSIIKFEYVVAIENDEKFEDATKSVKFYLSTITAEAVLIDSVNYINATLTDAKGDPIEGEDLKLQLQRLFAPLTIGESSYETDDEGAVSVEITDPMPGIDGILTFEIILDSKKYGIVKNIFEAPIGKVIVDQSTYDKRTMWSPPNKTPIFLWIFPNLVILGIWFVIGLLVFNLIKIYKS